MSEIIASISAEVIAALSLSCDAGTPIYLGQSNIEHMRQSHPADYEKYFSHIKDILREPEYVGINPRDNSIEYVREFKTGNEFVKVAVRIALSGRYYARSLYVLNSNRARNFICKGTLKSLTNFK